MQKARVTNDIIRHKAFVNEVKGDTITVTITQSPACSSCHARDACNVSDNQEKSIEILQKNPNVSPGQEVTVLFQESAGLKALFFGYILPFILVTIVLIVVNAGTNREVLSGLLALGILIPYYLAIYFFRHKLKKVLKFEVEETDSI